MLKVNPYVTGTYAKEIIARLQGDQSESDFIITCRSKTLSNFIAWRSARHSETQCATRSGHLISDPVATYPLFSLSFTDTSTSPALTYSHYTTLAQHRIDIRFAVPRTYQRALRVTTELPKNQRLHNIHRRCPSSRAPTRRTSTDQIILLNTTSLWRRTGRSFYSRQASIQFLDQIPPRLPHQLRYHITYCPVSQRLLLPMRPRMLQLS